MGCEVRGAVVGQPARVRAVRVGYMDIEGRGTDEALGEEGEVVLRGFRCLGVVGPPHDLRAVGAVERAAVVAEPVGDARDVGAVRAHRVQVEVAVAHRGEDDAVAGG